MISGETISNVTGKALIMSIMGNLCDTKSQKISPHFFVDLYNKDINQISFVLNSIRTSLGTFWEVIAEEFAKLEDYDVMTKSEFKKATNLPPEIKIEMQNMIDQRLSGDDRSILDYCESLDEMYENKPVDSDTISWESGEGVDLYFKKEDKYFIFDVKTVQINSGSGNKFDQQLIKWLTNKKHQLGRTISAKNITVGYIFPYNSKAVGDRTSHEEWMQDQGSKAKPMTEKEIYAANKFWKFITENPNALMKIFAGIEKALEGNSIVKKNLDKFIVPGVMTPDELDSLAEEATKDFAKYLYEVDFESKNEKWHFWSHRKDDGKCTFKKSINAICKNADGAKDRIGLERYQKGFNKCPKCNDEFIMRQNDN